MLKVILNRLKPKAEKIMQTNAGFKAGRRNTEQIFNVRTLFEKFLQQQQNLYHVFIDFTKADVQLYAPLRGCIISVQI